MKELELKLKEWWSGLALREKQAVSIGGFLLVVFILYAGIWSPYLNHVDNLRKRISSDRKVLLYMQETDKKIKSSQGQAHEKNLNRSSMSLLNQIKIQINQAGLEQSVTQLKQAGNETMDIHFQKVEFNALIKLLSNVMKEQGVSIVKVSANAIGTPGYVNADVSLK